MEAFVRVVELGGFSRAAEELHVSQPSVSAYIAALEKELGAVLINRSRGVFLVTSAGEHFLGHARKMLTLKRESIEALHTFSGEVIGQVRILASSVPALYILPRLLAGFHRLHPKVSFDVRSADTAGVVAGLSAHKADVGFAGSMLGQGKCDFMPFANERLVLIAPPDSPLREDEPYPLAELLYEHCFIAREHGSGTRLEYEKFLGGSGVTLEKIRTVASMDSTQGIINAVAGGLGVSIVSELAATQNRDRLKVVRLQNELPVRDIYAVLRTNTARSHLVELFMEYVTRR